MGSAVDSAVTSFCHAPRSVAIRVCVCSEKIYPGPSRSGCQPDIDSPTAALITGQRRRRRPVIRAAVGGVIGYLPISRARVNKTHRPLLTTLLSRAPLILTIRALKFFCVSRWDQRVFFFQFEIIVNGLVRSFRFIWIPMVCVYD